MMPSSLKLLVVDDTTTYRMIVRQAAEAIPGIEVVDFAANGRIALEKLNRLTIDVVLLDVEMPEMDGLTTLRHINERHPHIVVIMVSGASHSNANIVVECLNCGALDFVTKPLETDIDHSRKVLIGNLRPILSVLVKQQGRKGLSKSGRGGAAAAVPWQRSGTPSTDASGGGSAVAESEQTPTAPPAGVADAKPAINRKPIPGSGQSSPNWDKSPALLLIGASTGGPAALTQILKGLGSGLPIPVLIVQHMPPMFTASLAAQLSRTTSLVVEEATDDQEVKADRILLAPGGRHLSVKRQGRSLRTVLHDGPKVNGCRPAVDVLFLSVMASFAEPTLAVVLTGMGTDGANGVSGLKRLGKTYCITQSRDSCVVYGMPRAVVEMGLSDAVVPLEQMGASIAKLCRARG
ncbi:MAG: chemotaxis-specific protein-glutamate methyltransferase CheB [Magnetococcales bacterium]|nr:chemotaxis-specific protein-glutamate methyltransferase CheB [Magnetococcales bacterium]